MTINYGGDAGGQPRLLIPTIDQIVDPSVKTAMNAILRWANTLLMGGGGAGLLAYAYYLASVSGSTNPVLFGAPVISNFTYVTSGLITPPPDSITLLLAKTVTSGFAGMTDPVELVLELLSHAGATVEDQAVTTGGLNAANSAFGSDTQIELIFEDTNAGLPFQLNSILTHYPNNTPIHLTLLSWSKP